MFAVVMERKIDVSIQPDLNNDVVSIVSSLPLIFNSSCSIVQIFEYYSTGIKHNQQYRHFHVPHLFQLSERSKDLSLALEQQNPPVNNLFLSCSLTLHRPFWRVLGDSFVTPREHYGSRFLGWILVCVYTI